MHEKKELRYEHRGVTFFIRGEATRGDQYEMHAAMADGTEIVEGRVIKAKSSVLYPWLIERFVTGWSIDPHFTLKKLMDQPADPGEDLILILGAYILNHTGMVATQGQEALKNA